MGTELSHDVLNPAQRSALMGRTAQPLEAPTLPGCGEPTIRGAKPSHTIRTLKLDKPVNP